MTRLEFVPCGAREREVSRPGPPARSTLLRRVSGRPALARHQVTRDRELRAARLSGSPAARAEPRRAPSDCSAPSHTRPARPVTQPGIGGAPARPGWRRRDPGTRPSTCPFGPVALGLSHRSLEGPRWELAPPSGWVGDTVSALPAARAPGLGEGRGVALSQAPPHLRPQQGETF